MQGCCDPSASRPLKAARPSSGAFLELLGEFGPDALLLELRKVLDEDLAAQMIHLVLQANRQQALRLERERIRGTVS
jgi:hypothetical protein